MSDTEGTIKTDQLLKIRLYYGKLGRMDRKTPTEPRYPASSDKAANRDIHMMNGSGLQRMSAEDGYQQAREDQCELGVPGSLSYRQ